MINISSVMLMTKKKKGLFVLFVMYFSPKVQSLLLLIHLAGQLAVGKTVLLFSSMLFS